MRLMQLPGSTERPRTFQRNILSLKPNRLLTLLWNCHRPFHWNGSIFVGFSMRVAVNLERMAVAEMLAESNTFRLHQIFDKPIHGDINRHPGTEKNWGFFESNDSLLIMYKVFPCTHVLEYQPDHPRHAEERLVRCYKDPEHVVRDHTLLDIETDVHISCNPILWRREGQKDELLMMVHVRDTYLLRGYNHWLLRLDAATHEVTHVSYGIIIGAALHHATGHLPNVVIVGSISLVERSASTYLIVFGGEGDQYSIHERIDLGSVAWLELQNKVQMERVGQQLPLPTLPENTDSSVIAQVLHNSLLPPDAIASDTASVAAVESSS